MSAKRSARCSHCGKTITMNMDGTLRHHLMPKTTHYRPPDCPGSGRLPAQKLLRDTFPGVVGSRWRDRDGDVWVLCLDGQMRQTRHPTTPQKVEDAFGPMTQIPDRGNA